MPVPIELNDDIIIACVDEVGSDEAKARLEKYSKDELIQFILTLYAIGCLDNAMRNMELFDEGVDVNYNYDAE